MKKLLALLLSGICYFSSNAVPACPTPVKEVQPDGTEITLVKHGDEFVNWTTTLDSYTVVKNEQGYYVYAEKNANSLIPTNVIANNAEKRTATEQSFLQKIKKNLAPSITTQAASMKAKSKSMAVQKGKEWDYTKFRGLVILVNFNDRSFFRTDAHELFDNMINKEDYDGFMTTSAIPSKQTYTGSVHDYFRDNSYGLFNPKFDVVGPVNINYSQYYPRGTSYASTVVSAALKAADAQVNFADYDTDKDGEVDMVYFVFAGGGSNYQGNDSRLIWPHASYNSGYYDGVRMGRYACSTELAGPPSSNIIDGIGTICHEFSHVIGLMDEYDTDYDSGGGQSADPGIWSIMAGGSYLNNSRTPCGYSLLQKYQSKFVVPTTITEPGSYTLNSLYTTTDGYRINSGVKNEYFLLENRQLDKWNKYLPNHGMLIFRVDSTSTTPWSTNKINANPAHNYYEMIRAKAKNSGMDAWAGDPFPGSGNISFVNNETTPNLKSWTGVETEFTLDDITENNGVITFTAANEPVPTDVEDFEGMDVTTADATGIKGSFCDWSLTGAKIATNDNGYATGKRCLAMVKKAQVKTSVISKNVKQMMFDIYNSSTSSAMLTCYYSKDNGNTWITLKTLDGLEGLSVGLGTKITPIYNVLSTEPIMLRIAQVTGSASTPCYIDNVILRVATSGVEDVIVDPSNESLKAWIDGDNVRVESVKEGVMAKVYDVRGALVGTAKVQDGVATIKIANKGFYIVSDGANTIKVVY